MSGVEGESSAKSGRAAPQERPDGLVCQTAETIRAYFVSTYPADTADLELDSDLVSGLLSDSLAIAATVAFLEEEFAIRVKRAHINGRNFGSIAALSEYVSSQLTQSGG